MSRYRTGFQVLLAFASAVLCLFLFEGRAASQAPPVPTGILAHSPNMHCSAATLKGTFGVLERGTILVQFPSLPAPPVAFSNVALATYDGAGNFSGTYTASDNGTVVSGTFSGTYTVNPDCTMSDDFVIQPLNLPAHHTGAILGHGPQQEIEFIYADVWIAASGTAKRTPARGCSARMLQGRYVESLEGALVGTPLVPAVETGVTTYDGAGHFAGTFSSTLGSGAGAGTYSVNADCTCSILGTSGDGAGSTSVCVITGEEPFQEIQAMFTVPWIVASGPSKRQ